MPKNNSIFNCLKGLCKVGSTGGGDVSSKVYKKETVLKLYKSARRLVYCCLSRCFKNKSNNIRDSTIVLRFLYNV